MNRFPLGQTLATPGALEALQKSGQSPTEFLQRHARCDWGDVCAQDHNANEDALVHGARLFSVYHTSAGDRLWLITEADRSASTLLTPSEY